MHLEQFNSASRTEAAEALRPCLDIPRWIDELADARPYPGLAALLEAGRRAANPFTPAEIEAALAHHPRIGERAPGQQHGGQVVPVGAGRTRRGRRGRRGSPGGRATGPTRRSSGRCS